MLSIQVPGMVPTSGIQAQPQGIAGRKKEIDNSRQDYLAKR
jgi:hypothetical protein